MSRLAAAAYGLRHAPEGTPYVVEPADGPRFPNGVVVQPPIGVSEDEGGAVTWPLSANRWWDARCPVGPLDPAGVERFVADTEPIVLPGPVESCVGWGPGLTPAADDVLVGLLIGLHASGASAEAHDLAARCAEAETVPFSRALIDHAGRGEAVRPLLDLIRALGSPGGDDSGSGSVEMATERLQGFGSTSGRHMIDGVRRAMVQVASE